MVYTRRSWRWCVKGGKGSVAAAFTRKGRVALVSTTAPHYGNRHIGPGTRLRRLRLAYPRRRAVAPGILRAGPRSPRLFGIRRGRVRYLAVSKPRTTSRPRALRAYLRFTALVAQPRKHKRR